MSTLPTDVIRVYYNGRPHLISMDLIRRHPDGEALILPYADRDMTAAYDLAGHSKFTTWRLGFLRERTADEQERARRRWNVGVGVLAATTSVMALYAAVKSK